MKVSIQAEVAHRARSAAGRCAYVEYDGRVVDLLVRTRWLPDGDAHDPREVGRAITEMVRDAARRAF